MNILIDIGHPAHVHLFKNFAHEMQKRGNKILFTCRDKEFEIKLLKHNAFQYKSFGKKYISVLGKIWGMIRFDWQEFLTAIRFKPDIFLSHGSMYAAHAAFFLRKPHLSFEDTFNFEQIRLYKPFTRVIFTSDYSHPFVSKKEISYAGYHELAYLYPSRFKPDNSVLQELGVTENDKYVIMRFVSWSASHDIGHKGITYQNKLKAIEEFSRYASVFISSEAELPEVLKKNQIRIAPHRMHDALAYADLIFGESSTMSEEAAILGIPSVYLFNKSTYYTQHLEKDYRLMFNYSETEEDQQKAIEKGVELLKQVNLREEWLDKKNKMLTNKIDVTAFFVWFVENYPQSVKIMRDNSDYQYNFR